MQLCIDAGNTFIKAALFINNHLVARNTFSDHPAVSAWVRTHPVETIIISTVNGDEEVWQQTLSAYRIILFSNQLPLPVKNLYKTPQTLGKDRLAAALGAMALFPEKNCLVIDAGTCITYEIVTAAGEYLGGAISPGLTMRFKALNHFTAKLPLVTKQEQFHLTGNDTVSCILSGVQNGIIFEVESIIMEYSAKYSDLQVILCGGDTDFFESKIKGGIFAFPDLVLVGLNYSLLYNAHR